MTEQTARPVLIFEAEALDSALEALGYETKQAKADFLNQSRPAFSKIIRGLAEPSPSFIAAVLVKQPELTKRPGTELSPFFRAELR